MDSVVTLEHAHEHARPTGWRRWLLSTNHKDIGTLYLALSIIGMLVGLYAYFLRKEPAGNNPWGAGATSLEWTLSSPPPFHQFEVLPRFVGGDH
jgi:cytochrome c oxidase subunit 1